MTAVLWVLATLIVLVAIKCRPNRHRLYRCRARGCDRTFADPLERSSHYRKAHAG